METLENGEEQGKELDETGRTTVGGIQCCLLWEPHERWCERSEIPQSEEFPPTRLLK